MNSLPVGGITMRTACGTITLRRIWRRVMPSARPASSCPGSTESRPARRISDMYAASFSESVIHAAMNGVNQLCAKTCHHVGSAYQTKYSCSSVGVARKSQLYIQEPSRTERRGLSTPSATKKPITIAVASETIVSSRAVSAPRQYGPEESADQKRCESKLATTVSSLHVADRDLVFRRQLGERPVRPQRLDAARDLRPERVSLAVVDPELVLLRERVADRDLPRVRLRLERERGVLRQDDVGAAEDHLRDRVVVAGVALQVEADLRLLRLQVLLVLRAGLHGDVQALQPTRARDVLRVAGLDDEDAMRLHVRDGGRLLEPVRRDEDAADHRVALLRGQGGDQAGEGRLQRLRRLAERLRERGRHVDVEAADRAARRGELHRRERRVGAVRERAGAARRARRDAHRDEREHDDRLSHSSSSLVTERDATRKARAARAGRARRSPPPAPSARRARRRAARPRRRRSRRA